MAAVDGYALEHRKVMWDAEHELDRDDQVHHVNGEKTDNRIENLVVMSASDHHRLHVAASGMVTNQYGQFTLRRVRC